MTIKFDNFKQALLELCNAHQVKVYPGFSDGHEVCDNDEPLEDLDYFDLIDGTEDKAPTLG